MKFLVTGGCGFLGSNLAAEVIQRDHELCVLDSLNRAGGEDNLRWLKTMGVFTFIHGDTRCVNDVEKVVGDFRPDVIFHLAGQVAMSTSLADPRRDFETNIMGGVNLLEAVRKLSPESIVVYSSTNKVYGDLETIRLEETETRYVAPDYPNGFDETLPLDFRTPYGCSKGATDQYMLDYSRMFGVRSIVFRHSSIFGGRQFATYDQGWIGWFIKQGISIQQGVLKEPFTISGDGKQVRDVIFVSDLVSCYFSAIKAIEKTSGQPFNIGGGMVNSLSLLELFAILEDKLGIEMKYRRLPWRASDQKVYCADIRKALKVFGWRPEVTKMQGVEKMIAWCRQL
jgi:CDP-paratose 2-epimerase